MQPSSKAPALSTVVRPRTGIGANRFRMEPATRAVQLARCSATGIQPGVRRHLVRQVVVLEVSGQLRDVVQELTHAVQIALADGPRGVVCDLSQVVGGTEPGAVEALAAIGSHVRDWPGVPVAVACPDLRVRQALAAQPLGGHLIAASSLFSAVSAVLATPAVAVTWLHLAPHPTAMRASRDFVTRTLLDWQLGRAIRFARLVISELVMSSTMNTGTDMDLSVAWNLGALRLTVRDYRPNPPRRQDSAPVMQRRGVAIVSGLSRTFGVLPTADGGTVVWAILAAPRQPLSTSPPRCKPAPARRETPEFTDALGMDGQRFCGETGSHRGGRRAPTGQ